MDVAREYNNGRLYERKKACCIGKDTSLIEDNVLEWDCSCKSCIYYNSIIESCKKNNIPLSINCGQITITPKLFIGPKDDDTFQTFTYTKDELINNGFKMTHIKKMMKAIKNNLISFEKSSISITELLKKTQK
jgi:hypothetical protein